MPPQSVRIADWPDDAITNMARRATAGKTHFVIGWNMLLSD